MARRFDVTSMLKMDDNNIQLASDDLPILASWFAFADPRSIIFDRWKLDPGSTTAQ
jgi:hypothetical protein